jgi:hypothetical protein
MKFSRTYPPPDSPAPNIGPRERALAVFKYLLDLEPEAAQLHRLFNCIAHSYAQTARTADNRPLQPSLVETLTSERYVPNAPIEPLQGEKL